MFRHEEIYIQKLSRAVTVFGIHHEIHSRQMYVCEEEEDDNLPYPEGDRRTTRLGIVTLGLNMCAS